MSVDDAAAVVEINQLVGFVGHANAQVRLQATKMVTSLSSLDHNRRLISTTLLIPALAKQLTDSKEIAREVLKSLINFAEDEELTLQMLSASLIGISMECLRDVRTDMELRELLLMFLTNVTRDEKGASTLLQEGALEGLHVRRLLGWFTTAIAPTANRSALDPNAYCAHILTNISQLPAGRRLLLSQDRGYITSLKPQLASASTIRRVGTFQLIKNCFIESTHHELLLSSDLGLFPLLLAPIIGNEAFMHGESEYAGISPIVRAMMKKDKRRDADAQVRVLVYEIILLCAKHKPSRTLLRSQAIYPILRHAHDQEKLLPENKQLDELLEQLVPFFILDEDSAQHPDAIDAERKRGRVEQLKAINDKESSPTPTTTDDATTKKVVVEEQPIHYLGDELGGNVRRQESSSSSSSSSSSAAAPVAASSSSSAPVPVISASSVPPSSSSSSAAVDLDDAPFDFEPFGSEETAQLGDVVHNTMTIAAAIAITKRDDSKSVEVKKEIVYAQPEVEEEEEEDAPPPLAEDEERYMNGLD